MIWNDQYHFIFIHNPKTAGKSVTRYFPRKRGQKPKFPAHTPRFGVVTDYYSFAFVRNPWDRLVSLYHFMYQKCQNSKEGWDPVMLKEMGFTRWLYEHDGRIWSDNQYGENPRLQERDQSWWVDGCDFVGMFENLQEDINTVRDIIRTPKTDLIWINDSKHADYRTYYDDDSAEFVAKHHKTTIERFNYSFENINGI